MIDLSKLLSSENPVLRAYIFYGCILGLKLLAVVLIIGKHRWTKKIFISPEDATALNTSKVLPFFKGSEVKHDDPDVERCRRAHLNDLENILIFLTIAFFYVLSDPNPDIAINLFRVFTAARIIHTFVYAVFIIPQPSRMLAFTIGYVITIYMAIFAMIKYY